MGTAGGEGLADRSLALPPLASTQAMAFDGLDGLDFWTFVQRGLGRASRLLFMVSPSTLDYMQKPSRFSKSNQFQEPLIKLMDVS